MLQSGIYLVYLENHLLMTVEQHAIFVKTGAGSGRMKKDSADYERSGMGS
jgi:hypothetical protein